jgi:hypothetical protein
MVRFGSVNGCDQKCDGRDFILVSFHPGSKFSKKKKSKHFKISEGRPKVLLYIFPKKNSVGFLKNGHLLISDGFLKNQHLLISDGF